MIKAAIFDIDGTLIDSVDAHAQAWTAAFAEIGVTPPFEVVRTQIGKGADKLLPVFLTAEDVQRSGKVVETRQGEIFRDRYLERIKPFVGVRDLFQRLNADGVACVLASSGKASDLPRYEEIAGIVGLVTATATADDAAHSKPAPDIILAALARLSPISADACVFIGDTPYDAQAAVRSHVTALGVLSGGFDEAELRAAGCIRIYRDINDISVNYAACFR